MFRSKEVNMEDKIDVQNAKGLIDLAIIFARNNCNEFFATDLLKHTTYSHSDLDALAKNYIEQNKLSIKWKVD